jgi:hypothetical protein
VGPLITVEWLAGRKEQAAWVFLSSESLDSAAIIFSRVFPTTEGLGSFDADNRLVAWIFNEETLC